MYVLCLAPKSGGSQKLKVGFVTQPKRVKKSLPPPPPLTPVFWWLDFLVLFLSSFPFFSFFLRDYVCLVGMRVRSGMTHLFIVKVKTILRCYISLLVLG